MSEALHGVRTRKRMGALNLLFCWGHIPQKQLRHQTQGLKRQAGQSADGRAGG